MNHVLLLQILSALGLILTSFTTRSSAWTNVEVSSFYSDSRNRYITFAIYTPPGYQSGDQHYPVLYFLHGRGSGYQLYWAAISEAIPEANGDAGAWINQLITSGKIPPIIIVTPDDTDGYWSDTNETMITQELINHIDSNWRTIPERYGRAIEGFSMGAMGASQYAARNPNLYCSTIIMSIPEVEPQFRYWQDNYENIIENQLMARIIVGEEDGCCYDSTVQFHNDLSEIEIPHEFETYHSVTHYFGGLYELSGIEGLQFHADCFLSATPPPQKLIGAHLPIIYKHFQLK